MKKTLLFSAMISWGILYSGMLSSQCIVSDLAIELKSAVNQNGVCQVVFNFSWNQEVNSGNKFAYLHLWRTDQYPDLNGNGLAYTNPPDYPTSADLVNALTTIVIDDNGSATPIIGTVYHPEPGVTVLGNGVTVVKENVNAIERMTIKNITLTLPDCNGIGITGDIWASQASNGKNVHCVSSGVSLIVGNPRLSGLLFCNVPRQYSVQVTNEGSSAISVSYNIYIDEGDGDYEPIAHDLKITSTPVGPINLISGGAYQSGPQSYLPYSQTKPYSDHGLWVEVTTAGTNFKTIYFITNTCSPLPVQISSFTARRDQSIVRLAWTTSTELNNNGFEVQKKINAGDFETFAFVPTQAAGGNSQSLLEYSCIDFNASDYITQYRLKQIDINGQIKYSEIRAVRGLAQKTGVIIYPNPTVNGQVNMLLQDNNNVQEVLVIDMSGKIIRQLHNVSGSTILTVSNLVPGTYSLQVFNKKSGERIVEKFVVIR